MKKTLLLGLICLTAYVPAIAQWDIVPNNLTENVVDVVASDTTELFVVGSNGSIYNSEDAGHTFQLTYDATTDDKMKAFCSNTNIITRYACGENGKVLEYTPSGWVEYTTPIANRLNDIYYVGELIGYAVGENGTIIKTSDGGSNWNIVQSPTTQWLTSVYAFDQNNVKIVGDGGLVISTTNGGDSWSQTTIPGDWWLGSVWLNSPTTGWLSGTEGKLYQINAEGYIEYPTETTNGIVSLNIPFSNYGHGVGDNGYITRWNGVNWEAQVSPTTNWLNSVTSYYNSDNKSSVANMYSYACGENGTILSSTELVTGINNPTGPSKRINLCPNPASDNAFLVGLKENEKASVLISTVNGLIVANMQLEYPLNVAIPVAELSNGIYIVTIKTSRGFFAEKLLVKH
ncbi:MAG: T9SS type A sorting domain-containing protein [Bacteroidales bacterium]|nr:T9SS type A sorting domain-containing protein [Bacteroidales bacterium]